MNIFSFPVSYIQKFLSNRLPLVFHGGFDSNKLHQSYSPKRNILINAEPQPAGSPATTQTFAPPPSAGSASTVFPDLEQGDAGRESSRARSVDVEQGESSRQSGQSDVPSSGTTL